MIDTQRLPGVRYDLGAITLPANLLNESIPTTHTAMIVYGGIFETVRGDAWAVDLSRPVPVRDAKETDFIIPDDTWSLFASAQFLVAICAFLLVCVCIFVVSMFRNSRNRTEFDPGEYEAPPAEAGVPSDLMGSMPIVTYSPVGETPANARDGTQEEQSCSICLIDFERGEKLLQLPCKHLFHEECITRWTERHTNCPNCRHDILGDNEPQQAGGSGGSGGRNSSEARRGRGVAAVVPVETAASGASSQTTATSRAQATASASRGSSSQSPSRNTTTPAASAPQPVVPALRLQGETATSGSGDQTVALSGSRGSTARSSTAWGEQGAVSPQGGTSRTYVGLDSRPSTGASNGGAASVSNVELGAASEREGGYSSRQGANLSVESVSR